MNGIRTGRLDNFAVSGRNDNSLEFKMRQVLIIKNLKNSFIFPLFVLQLHRQLSLLSRRQVLPSLNTVLKQWTNLCEKPPTGFEKYFDKDKKSKQDDQKSNSRSSKPSFDSAFKKKINRMSQGLVHFIVILYNLNKYSSFLYLK